HFPGVEIPHVCEGGGEALPCLLVLPAVLTERDDCVALLDELARNGSKAVPLSSEPHEDTLEDRVGTRIGARVGETRGLGPLDVRRKHAEKAGDIPSCQ